MYTPLFLDESIPGMMGGQSYIIAKMNNACPEKHIGHPVQHFEPNHVIEIVQAAEESKYQSYLRCF